MQVKILEIHIAKIRDRINGTVYYEAVREPFKSVSVIPSLRSGQRLSEAKSLINTIS